eukprot:424125_1
MTVVLLDQLINIILSSTSTNTQVVQIHNNATDEAEITDHDDNAHSTNSNDNMDEIVKKKQKALEIENIYGFKEHVFDRIKKAYQREVRAEVKTLASKIEAVNEWTNIPIEERNKPSFYHKAYEYINNNYVCNRDQSMMFFPDENK